jgi:cytochrome c-type biogenesis protein
LAVIALSTLWHPLAQQAVGVVRLWRLSDTAGPSQSPVQRMRHDTVVAVVRNAARSQKTHAVCVSTMAGSVFRDKHWRDRHPSRYGESMPDVGFVAALIAGVLSFLSPCVLPLVPPYLCYLAGTSVEELRAGGVNTRAARRDVMIAALAFVMGFSTVFVLLGATASVLGLLLRQYLWVLSWAAGLAIIAMGLHFLGVFRIALLYREKRMEVSTPAGPGGAYLMGLAFAFGWTPCIGPILAAILAVAGSADTVYRGMALLAVYSLGLGIPFLIAAFGIGRFMAAMAGIKQHFRKIELAMGGLLVVTGVAFLTGGMERMAFFLLESFPVLATLG